MPFPESDVIKGAVNNLKEIVKRSQSDNSDCIALLGQIESIVAEMERKAKSGQQQGFVAAPPVTVVV